MSTKELIREIQRLPLAQRMLVIEQALQSLRKSEQRGQMKKAAEVLQQEYRTSKELTAFTGIDFENFYEAR